VSEEIWKDVIGHEGLYQVSSLGRVKSFCRDKNGRILRPGKASKGYLQVRLFRGGKQKQVLVHRLVLEAHTGPAPSPKHEGNHRNGDKADNRIENLEWVTPEENIRHAFRELGHEGVKGETHGRAELTRRKVIGIRELWATGDYTQIELAEMFRVCHSTISYIVRRKTWRHVP